jgi:hypothetical protein
VSLALFLSVGISLAAAGSAGASPSPAPNAPAQATTTTAEGSSGGTVKVTFGVAPASATKEDARPYYSLGETPGARLADHVVVLNYSVVALTLAVYATDAVNTSDGGFSLLEAAQKPVDAGAWITVGAPTKTVTVPARSAKAPGQVVLPVHVSIPLNASPGDHVAGIVASLPTVAKNSKGVPVKLDQRVGTRVFIRVSGKLRPQLALTAFRAKYHGGLNPFRAGSVAVSYRVANTGNARLAAQQYVHVRNLVGGARSATAPPLTMLLPGYAVAESVHVRGVFPLFKLTTKVSVVPQPLPGDVDPGLVIITKSVVVWVIPWPLIVVAIVGLIACWLLVRLFRRRGGGTSDVAASRVRTPSPDPAPVP